MKATDYSIFNALGDIIAAPGTALEQIRSRTSWLWWPLLINLVLGVAAALYYVYWVDFPWLVDDVIAHLPQGSGSQAADAIHKFMSPGKNAITSGVGITVVTFLIYTLEAAYFHLANKLGSGADVGFGQWFSLASWSGFVNVFGALAVFVVILTASTNQLPQQALSPLSLNGLVIHAEPGQPWFTWGSSLSLLTFWNIILLGMGYARWTGSPTPKAMLVTLIPWVLIFGAWAFMQ